MINDLLALRKKHQEISIEPEIIQQYLDRYVALQAARRLTDIHGNPDGVRNMLREVKRLIGQTGDLRPARYALCTQVLIGQFRGSFIERAREEYRPERPESFICFWDIAEGIDKALMLLVGVIYELHGETNYRQRVLQTDPPSSSNLKIPMSTCGQNGKRGRSG